MTSDHKEKIVRANLRIHLLAVTAAVAASTAFGGTITIGADAAALTANFQNPGTTATVGYTIAVHADETNFYVDLVSNDPAALPFANLYFDTVASTPNTGSNLGFEFGQSSMDAFIPGVSGSSVPFTSAIGVTGTFLTTGSGITANIVVPNSFFLSDPLGMGFAHTPPGTLVSLHLSQSFGYSVVGGGANFAPPAELGDAIVNSAAAAPEPASVALFGLGMCALAFHRKFKRA